MICLCLYGGLHQESMIRTSRNPGYWLFWWWWNEKSSLVATTILAKEEVAPSSASQCRSLVLQLLLLRLASKFQTIIQWSVFSCMVACTKNVWFEQEGTLATGCFDDEAGNEKFSTSKERQTMLLVSLPLLLIMMSRIVLLCTLWTMQP